MPVTNHFHKKAWLTSTLLQFQQGCSIALVVDNCSDHQSIPSLRAIQLFFLQPNTTSLLQPCDQGIIKTFKHSFVSKSFVA